MSHCHELENSHLSSPLTHICTPQPDKPSGDADTFRVLNRAQRVLMNPKLRQQYDILGIDLDDEEGDHNTKDDDDDGDKNKQDQGIVHEIAGMILTNIISLAVKTRTLT